MARADYNARLIEEYTTWAIIDEDRGSTSVTNDIENVVAEICKLQKIEATDFKWTDLSGDAQ